MISFSPETLDILRAHPWPGNIRELINVIERGVILCREETFSPDYLPAEMRHVPAGAPDAPDSEIIPLKEMEKRYIEDVLKRMGGKKGQTAKALGISWPTLNKILNR